MKSREKIKMLESYLAVYKEFYKTSCDLYQQKKAAEDHNDEIRALLEDSMMFLINFPVNTTGMSVKEMITKNVNYRDNLYAFILERGLLHELIEYHKSVDMLSPGGHDRVVSYLKSRLVPDGFEFDPSWN